MGGKGNALLKNPLISTKRTNTIKQHFSLRISPEKENHDQCMQLLISNFVMYIQDSYVCIVTSYCEGGDM